jgi:uncharacterized protein YprB with RNaseH-like and TPR domain
MENLLKKQLAQIKARALAIAGRAAADSAGAPRAQSRETSNEIVDAVVKTGAVVRGADFEASRKPPRFAWWRRRREVRSNNEYGYEGAFQRLLSSFGDEAAVPIEEAVPGEAQKAEESMFYLIRAAGDAIDTAASEHASRFATFRTWPAETLCTRIGAQPVDGMRDSVEVTGEASPSSVLFLDIETAGLSANTYVFLVGLMYWVSGEFRVEQVFARDYTEEEGLLRYVRSMLERFDTVVTYNGASFDLPFLRTRMTVHRVPDVEPIGSVDLLHAARRVFRPALPNCRLVTVEEYLRGVGRVDDIPSRFIPRAYHEFVRSKDARIMRNVVYHNRMDVFTMAVILNHLGVRPDVAAAGVTEAADAVEMAPPENRFASPPGGDTMSPPNPPHEAF